MQRGRGPGRLELREEPDRFAGRERVDRDAATPERLERLGIGLELSVGTGADHEPGGEVVEHVLEILENESVSLPAPPVPDAPAGEHDHVAAVLVAVHDHPAELVALDPGHSPRVAPTYGTSTARPVISPSRRASRTSFTASSGCVSVRSVTSPWA